MTISALTTRRADETRCPCKLCSAFDEERGFTARHYGAKASTMGRLVAAHEGKLANRVNKLPEENMLGADHNPPVTGCSFGEIQIEVRGMKANAAL